MYLYKPVTENMCLMKLRRKDTCLESRFMLNRKYHLSMIV